MFFPQLMSIRWSDSVLEIGPGAYPFWRSDCLADVFDENSNVDLTQFGGAQLNTKGKPLYRIENNRLPFKDNSFDYVICSHVFEHVPCGELSQLAQEIMRVSKRAYIEFPRPLFDHIYNFDVHVNLLDIVDGEIICLDKTNTAMASAKYHQQHALSLRARDRFSIDEHFASVVAVGKEFHNTIPIKFVSSEEVFFHSIQRNDYFVELPGLMWRIGNKLHPMRLRKLLFGEKTRDSFLPRLLSNKT